MELGAEVVEHTWEGYAAQKNWALAQVAGRADWVLFLDADEWIPDELAAEIRTAIASPVAGYHIPRRNVFEGRVLRHAWWYPDYQLRLFRSDRGRFEDRLVHEHVIVDGSIGFLAHPLMHENLKGLNAFLARHIRYADLEAREIIRERSGQTAGQRRGRLLGTWPERRRFLKTRIWYQLPARPAIRFVWMFFIKRGFLDGRQGLVYCQLIAAYEAMIDARLLELERAKRGVMEGSRHGSDGLPRFVCPDCRERLAEQSGTLACAVCGQSYAITDDIPVLLRRSHGTVDPTDDRAHADEHEGTVLDSHKAAQQAHFDHEMDEEFEVTRPHGTPRLYRFLVREKLRRATRPLGPDIHGSTALTVCGGSGMDAEFLARAGWAVVSSDISLEAARRTRARAQRYGVRITPIVADIEHLPFADASMDLVLVHDGLHHLDRPEAGLAEMARVAKRWVSVTEPASAAVTKAAVRVGFSVEWEDAGNRVRRLTSAEVQDHLADAGFSTLTAQRYAMYYRHQPGPLFRIMSRRWVFPLVRAGWRAGNALFGRFGNKLVVVAERTTLATGQPPNGHEG
jgi:ubiquinone/menaquinone biosynthesis C-methylase UbiE/uncharacterized protein YbaR (Trm112 family)